jgi:hypothetical protein
MSSAKAIDSIGESDPAPFPDLATATYLGF